MHFIAFCFWMYLFGSVLTFTGMFLETNHDVNTRFRYAIFWPIYLARWLINNFYIAIKGK